MTDSTRKNSNTPKTAIIGAGGFLGKRLFAAHRKEHHDCVGTFHSSGQPIVDLKNPTISHLRLKETGHEQAIIAAFVVDVKKCEFEVEYTRQRNVDGVMSLVDQIIRAGIKPIFLSTDWVFDGKKGSYKDSDKTDATCGYGAQKAEVERLIQERYREDQYLIIRLSRMFTIEKGDNSTPDQIARTLSRGDEVHAAHDQIFGPLLVDDAVRAIIGLQKRNASGIVNVNSPEVYSRLQLALEIADEMRVERSKIKSISILDIDTIKRPQKTNMLCERLDEIAPVTFTPTRECLKQIAQNYT